jgi:hypothetical protein
MKPPTPWERIAIAALIGACLFVLAALAGYAANEADGAGDRLTLSKAQCDGHYHGATHGLARHDRLLRRAWSREDYADDDPRTDTQRERLEHFRRCAQGERVRLAMRESARDVRRAYRRWQDRAAFKATYLIDCGPDHFVAALGCATVACESGYSWAPAGYYDGPYQIDPAIWGDLVEMVDPPWRVKLTHHLTALRILREQGRGAWPVCG